MIPLVHTRETSFAHTRSLWQFENSRDSLLHFQVDFCKNFSKQKNISRCQTSGCGLSMSLGSSHWSLRCVLKGLGGIPSLYHKNCLNCFVRGSVNALIYLTTASDVRGVLCFLPALLTSPGSVEPCPVKPWVSSLVLVLFTPSTKAWLISVCEIFI